MSAMTASELHRVLSDEIYKLRSGKAKSERTNAIANMASKIISNARLQFEYAKHYGFVPDQAFIGKLKPPAPKKAAKA